MNKKKVLEKFLLESEEFHKINSLISEPNFFEIIGVEKNENRHSNILSWLLNTSANHGLGDFFLRSFLKKLLSENNNDLEVNFFDIEIFDFDDIEVRREWNRIDILLISRQNNLVIVIENKIDSSEHSNQLNRYYNIINREFNDYHKVFVYLTREGEIPSDEENWLIFDYDSVLALIEYVLEYRKNTLTKRTLEIIKQYKIILRRYIVGNSEIEEICRNIYKKHKKALDLIFEHKPDINLEISDELKELISQTEGLILDDSGKTYIRFTSEILDNLIPKEGEGWTSTQRILLFEFANRENKLFLKFLIGPGESNVRKKLNSIVKKDLKLFNKANRNLSKKWFTVYKKGFLNKKHYEDLALETLTNKISEKFSSFIKNDLPRIEEHINNHWN
ncbi:MAG: PD-(D/E)XK nuclease family protein [Bacillota bacterium]